MGYLFILAIEILALLLKNSKIKPYTTKHGIRHLFDIYTHDHTIYLQKHPFNEKKNLESICNALEIIELFFVWSGLKINRGKTYLSIFGASLVCPSFVTTLRIKLCTEFKLLGINFDQTDENGDMDMNYESCFEKVKEELRSWKHRFLMIFGIITVI